MTDDRIDALIRQLDVPTDASAPFTERTLVALLPRVRRARRADARWFSGLTRVFGASPITGPTRNRQTVQVALLALVLLAVLFAVAVIGSRPRPSPLANGPLIVSTRDGLRVIAPGASEASAPVVSGSTKGASRSPDGRLVSFWTTTPSGDQLEVIGVNTKGRRPLTPGLPVAWNGCIDTWALDSHAVAAGVLVDDAPRILVADVVTGRSRLLTPPDVGATCPLWAPDGQSIAFAMSSATGQTLAVIGVDGHDLRVISGLAADEVVSGPDSWSADGAWIYYDAAVAGHEHRVYRADVARGVSEALTPEALDVGAPALSPDGARLAFIVERDNVWDLYAANADGTDIHLVLADAVNDGWSADSRMILADWRPLGDGGLLTIAPDGSGRQMVYPFPSGCTQSAGDTGCVDSIGWGQPRP